MGVSTLDEINNAVYNYIGGLLNGSYPSLFPSTNRIVFSVTGDDESIFRRFEEINQNQSRRVELPATAIVLNGFKGVTKPYGPRHSYISSEIASGGKSDTGVFAQVELDYQVRVFAEKMSDILNIMELWVLFISQQRLIEYHSDILDTKMAVELVYDIPKLSTIPTVSERWGGRGYVYAMDVEIDATSVIATDPDSQEQVSRILKLVATFSQQGKDSNTLISTFTIYGDKPTDSITETSLGS